MLAADRYVETIQMFLKHDIARRHPVILDMPKPAAQPVSKKANSLKAVQTRKGKYSESKLKRGTREDMKKNRGFHLMKENK